MISNEFLKVISFEGVNQLFQDHLVLSIMDHEGVIIELNDRYCELTGYSREELLGKHSRIHNSRHHPQSFFKEMWETILSDKVWQGDFKNRKKDGSFYWARTTIIPIFDANTKKMRFLDCKIDITETKEREERWIFEEEAFREICMITKTGGWSYFPKSGELVWTEETYKLHEVPLDEIITVEKAIQFYHPAARPVIEDFVAAAINKGEG